MQNYASMVKEQQKQHTEARMQVLRELHVKSRRQLQKLIAENKSHDCYVTYRVPLMQMDAPIVDLKYAMNYVMSGLSHDGFMVAHMHSNVIMIWWDPPAAADVSPFPIKQFI